MAPRNTRVNPGVETRGPARSFAQSLDNFYSPSRDRRSEQANQRALNQFSAIIGEKADRIKGQQREDEFNQGIADAMREEAGQQMKGVRTGKIFRQNSSFYMMGLNEQRGKAAGIKFRDQIALEYEQWEGKNSDDPNDFRNFMNSRSGAFIESLQGNPQMLNAALPYINQVASNTASHHTAYTNERLRDEQIEASQQVFADIVGGFSRGDYDEQDAIDALSREVNELYESGEKDARDIMLDAVIMDADAHDDMTGIWTLAKAVDQGKIKLSVAQKDKLRDATDALEAEIMSRESQRSKAEKDAYDAMINQNVTAYTEALLENPRLSALDFYRKTGIKDEGLFRKLNTIQKAVQEAQGNTGPTSKEVDAAFRVELLEAGGDPDARQAVLNKYSGQVSSATWNEELEATVEISQGSAVYESKFVDDLRKSYVRNVEIVANGEFDTGLTSGAQIYAETEYNKMMRQALRGVDPRNLDAIETAHLGVVKRLNRMMLTEYPGFRQSAEDAVGEESTVAGNADQMGLSGELKTIEQAEIAEQMKANDEALRKQQEAEVEAAREADAAARALEGEQPQPEGGSVLDRIDEMMGITNQAGAGGGGGGGVEDVPIEEQTPPFDDHTSEEPYPPSRDSFYGELIRRFTDGEDSRIRSQSYQKILESDTEFSSKLQSEAAKRGMNPQAILAVMDFETGGTFDTGVKNMAGSGATGLIQFMPNTAKALGTTVEQLADMSKTQQLDYVFKYFDQFNFNWAGMDVDDVYMSVLYPKAAGKSDGYVLFRSGTKAYTQNRGLDTNGDGTVTKFEAASKVRKLYYG